MSVPEPRDSKCTARCEWTDPKSSEYWKLQPVCICGVSAGQHAYIHPHGISPFCTGYTKPAKPSLGSTASSERLSEISKMTRANSTRGPWDDVDRLIHYCRANSLTNLAIAFESYEDNRRHTIKVVKNLESQLNTLADSYRKALTRQKDLDKLLKEAGIDPEVLLQTEEVFAEKKQDPKK